MNQSALTETFLEVAKLDALSGNEKVVADYIRTVLSKYDIVVAEDDSNLISGSNTGNIICEIGGGGELVLLSHMDTARPTRDLRVLVKRDRITSDGTTVLGVDNRVGIAVLLFAIEKIFKEGIDSKPFTVVFTTCEESTLLGSKNLRLKDDIKMGFVFDSSLRPGNFISKACGSKNFKIKIHGKAAHSGLEPEKGINALQIATTALNKIKQGRYNDETTINIGLIRGGTAINVVPDFVSLEGEVRSFDEQMVEKVIREINYRFAEEAQKVNGKIEFKSEWDFFPYDIDKDEEVYKIIFKALKNLELEPHPNVSLGGSDANPLNTNGIPTVNIGIGAQNPHSNEEFIYLEDLYKSAEIVFEIIKKD